MNIVRKLKITAIVLLLLTIMIPSQGVFAYDLKKENILPEKILTEPELTHIPFSAEWIMKNDQAPDESNVKITFPEKWVNEPPEIAADIKTYMLRVPFVLLADNDTNKSPDEVTVQFPNKYFIGMATPAPITPPPFDRKSLYDDPVKYTYQERWNYLHSGPGITGARGYATPYYYDNPDGETFAAFQEIEYYGDTGDDAIEIVSVFDENINNTHVGLCIWVDGNAYHSPDIYCSPGDSIYYEFYISGQYYYCYLIDQYNVWHYYNKRDTSMPTDFWWIAASNELDDKGGFSDNFFVVTLPVSMTDLKTTSWQGSSYALSTFTLDAIAYANYVETSVSISASGFYGVFYAGY